MTENKILQTALAAARKAGLKAREIRFGNNLGIQSKPDRSLVTAGDYASEKIIREIILGAYPDHMFLGEESSDSWSEDNFLAENLWIVDPVDGTTNYVYGLPHSGVSIAYASRGQVLVAVVYSIFNGEIFHAEKGKGAFLGDNRITCNSVSSLENCLVATGLPYKRPIPAALEKQLISVSNNCRDIKRLGAASLDLCYVACGRLDAYFETIQSWDMAAGALIVKEAGGKVVNFNLTEAQQQIPGDLNGQNLLAACPGVCNQLLALPGFCAAET